MCAPRGRATVAKVTRTTIKCATTRGAARCSGDGNAGDSDGATRTHAVCVYSMSTLQPYKTHAIHARGRRRRDVTPCAAPKFVTIIHAHATMSGGPDTARRRVGALHAHVNPRAPSFMDWLFGASAVGGAGSDFTVAVLGAAGGIGQSLSAFMKQNARVGELRLYDVAPVVRGVAVDVSHVNTRAVVRGYVGDAELDACLTGCDLVIIPAGVPRKPGMSRDDLFGVNAGIVRTLCEAIARSSPNAMVNIISNPVNSTVPIAAEVFKKAGCYDKRRLCGVTTLDVMRAKTFVAQAKGFDNPQSVDVPVIGGHAGTTILPLLSQTSPKCSFSSSEIEALTTRIQNGGTEVVDAKGGAGSATLSMAAAAAEFADACLRGLSGESGVWACAYVESDVTKAPYFATKVLLGKQGVERVAGTGPLSAFEKRALDAMMPELVQSIQKGVDFVRGSSS